MRYAILKYRLHLDLLIWNMSTILATKALHLFIAASFYYLFGKFGLSLAIPPGFASAVWPASGLALACVLLLNRSMALIGIGLGSFLINFAVASDAYTIVSWASAVPAIGIAIGAILQALVGSLLFHTYLSSKSIIDSPRDIIRFISIVAPVGCLIAPTFGITTLFINGLVTLENYWFSWSTWWVGDTIGILLFTPMILMLSSSQEQTRLTRKLQTVLPTMLIFGGVLLLFYTSTETRQQKITEQIEEKSQQFFQSIKQRMLISQNKLNAYAAFYRGSEFVNKREFEVFSETLLENDNVLQGVGWTRLILASERVAYEQSIRDSGFPDFSFTEISKKGQIEIAPLRDEYYPVLYIYPFEPNKQAFGLNLAAHPVRFKALMQASIHSKPVATEPIRLAQEAEDQLAMIMYYPIYWSAEKLAQTHGEKPLNPIRGFVSGVFRVSGILGSIIEDARRHYFGINITDITQPEQPKLLAHSIQTPLQQFDAVHKTLTFGTRILEFTFYPVNQFQTAAKDWTSWTILTIGFLIAAMLQSLILMITGTTENIRVEVERKTQDLSLAKKAAEDANEAKSNFTANMSHEIRTPLNAVIGLINLCLKTQLTDQQKDYLQKAKLSSGTLLSLINNTLDFSKIEAGKLELEELEFELPEILKKTQAIFSAQAMQQGINFEIQLPERLPIALIGDPLRLEQVILNLCSNAFKFTREGGVTLSIRVTSMADSNVTIDLTVSDTGIGIAQEQQQFLFESFRQADSSTSRKFGGSGLGLTISKQLVELMGGTIDFTSLPDKGSHFHVKLAFKKAESTSTISKQTLQDSFVFSTERESLTSKPFIEKDLNIDNNFIPERAHSDLDSSNKKLLNRSILLVDDMELNQIIAQAMLEEHGASVTIANNGIDALAKISEKDDFDLILMDIQMPEMDGYEATQMIRKDDSQIPILAMTANAMDSDIEKCKAIGMDGHVAKPIEEDDLIDKIVAQLDDN